MSNPTPIWAEDASGVVVGYMCLVDFEYELGGASGGNVIYPSPEDCRTRRRCTDSCGMVEVEVRARCVVRGGTME